MTRASKNLQVRAAQSSDSGVDVEQIVKDLQDRVRHLLDTIYQAPALHRGLRCRALQWDRVENKTAVAVYGVGAVVLLWFSSTIVSAVNSVPLVGFQPVISGVSWHLLPQQLLELQNIYCAGAKAS